MIKLVFLFCVCRLPFVSLNGRSDEDDWDARAGLCIDPFRPLLNKFKVGTRTYAYAS